MGTTTAAAATTTATNTRSLQQQRLRLTKSTTTTTPAAYFTMGGGNAFLRFSSSVAAGALILPLVARAQTTCVAPESPPGVDGCCAPVKTYEGCGSCEDPTLRLLTTVESSSDSLTTSTI